MAAGGAGETISGIVPSPASGPGGLPRRRKDRKTAVLAPGTENEVARVLA